MKSFLFPSLLVVGTLTAAGCEKDMANPNGQTCANESVLAVYTSQEALITKTQLGTYCLIADPADISRGSYLLDNYLVPSAPLPPQYQVEGLRVLLTGRKKSCYGLTTFPTLRTSFGYKLEIDDMRPLPKVN